MFTNAEARRLLGRDAVRTGGRLGEELSTELRVIVSGLVDLGAPVRATVIAVRDLRLRVSGVGATAGLPALLFVEDVSAEARDQRVMADFLRNAAHQLRTPLAGITAAVETLQAGAKETPADRDRFLAHVERHTERLSRVARGLLLLARAASGEPLRLERVELRPLLEELVATATPGSQIELAVHCPSGLTTAAAPDLLREALATLLDNALTHTERGVVDVRGAAAGDDHVLVSISDTGPGIPPELHERIFEPFFRLDQTGEGYGLGLAIARQAVEALHGEIDVSSTPGRGTTFTVRLMAGTRSG